MKARIVQPEGIKYLIRTHHHNREYAQEYIDMLIEKSENYIFLKKKGRNVAPLKTIEQLESELEVIKSFKIVDWDGV